MPYRFRFTFFSALLLLGFCASPAMAEKKLPFAMAEGGWEGSGGDGVACWNSQEEAQRAEAEIGVYGILSEKSKAAIASLVTLEYWEFKDKVYFPEMATSREQVLQKVQSFLEEYAPIFASQLKIVSDRISIDTWQKMDGVRQISDSTPARSIKKENGLCRLVQLAGRFSKSRGIGKFPEVFVELDQVLFVKLNPLNQAMLILHERLYLLGRMINHYNSDDVRKVVARLTSSDLEMKLLMGMKPVELSVLVQGFLVNFFGDYIQFFSEEIPQISIDRPNQYTRFRSFLAVNNRHRALLDACFSEQKVDAAPKDEKERLEEDCRFKVFSGRSLLDSFSSEEAFVFLARYHLQYSLYALNSEHLMVFDAENPLAVSAEQKARLREACSILESTRPELSELNIPVPKALDYCRSL